MITSIKEEEQEVEVEVEAGGREEEGVEEREGRKKRRTSGEKGREMEGK